MQYKTAALSLAKKNPLSIFVLAATAVLAFALFAGLARASITPSLSLSPTGDGNTVTVNVYGDPNASVELFYINGTGGSQQVAYLGMTNSNDTLAATVSSSQYNIASGSPVHVAVGGINGVTSATVAWPTVSNNSSSGITLSTSSVAVAVGQQSTVSAVNNTGSALYLYNNSNSPVANVNISGTSITVIGLTNGSTTLTICSLSMTTNCPSLYVTVQNSGSQTLSFSPTSTFTIAAGQSVPVTMSGGNGIYTVVNNSNQSIIFTNIVGNTITLTTSASSGSASITVCSTDMTACGILNVTAGTSSSSEISFGQSSLNVPTNQTVTDPIYGGAGSYYIQTNTNQGVVSANITGAVLNLTGLTSGTSSITVCSSDAGCGTVFATTNYVANGGALSLSQTTLSLAVGQTLSITISGGTAPYSVATPSTSLYSTSINGNILTVTGLSAGSQQVAVCSASGGCTWLSLSVNGSSVGTSGLSLSQSSLTIAPGQSTSLTVYGSGSYYVSGGNTSVATASVSGSIVYINAVNVGSDSFSVCQNGGQCATVYLTVGSANVGTTSGQASLLSFGTPLEALGYGQYATVPIVGGSGSYYVAYSTNPGVASATVSGSSLLVTGSQSTGLDIVVVCSSTNSCGALPIAIGSVASTTTTTTTTTTSGSTVPGDGYVFTQFLENGDQGTEVVELQKRLGSLGYFGGSDTGYFGALTQSAVEAFQSAHGISPVGYVGPSTRAALNQ